MFYVDKLALAQTFISWMKSTSVISILLIINSVVHSCVLCDYIQQQHPFNGPLSGTTWVSWYQKGKTSLDFTEARGSEWQWHQLGHMQVCTSPNTDTHTSTPPLIFAGWMLFLPLN